MRALTRIVKGLWRRSFELAQRAGVNILPAHFYSPTPDMRDLKRTQKWREAMPMHGVRGTDIEQQSMFLSDLCPPGLIPQWETLDVHGTACREQGEGGGYGVIEANVLHAFVQRYKPQRIVQIGCGVSTSIILRAASMAGYQPEIICIDPYPSAFLRSANEQGRISLIDMGAEVAPLDVLTALRPGDMLFVDSTHTVKPGSEVNRIILDVLPRLGDGIYVHFHDIYFPYDYQRNLLSSELFINVESTLLHAFLIGNQRYQIVLSLSMLHYAVPERVKAVMPHYEPEQNSHGLSVDRGIHFPSATYILSTAANPAHPI